MKYPRKEIHKLSFPPNTPLNTMSRPELNRTFRFHSSHTGRELTEEYERTINHCPHNLITRSIGRLGLPTSSSNNCMHSIWSLWGNKCNQFITLAAWWLFVTCISHAVRTFRQVVEAFIEEYHAFHGTWKSKCKLPSIKHTLRTEFIACAQSKPAKTA